MDIEPLPAPVRLPESVYENLRNAIFAGVISPGTRLSVPLLAARLGVSRSPVREAVARLCQERLAHDQPRRGAVVALISLKELAELYEVRAVLEGLAARLAIGRNLSSLTEDLRTTLEEHRVAVEEDDVAAHRQADMRFHGLMRQHSGNQELINALNSIQVRVQLAMLTTNARTGARLAFADHRSIFEAVEAADADTAERRARAHVDRLRTVLLEAAHTDGSQEPEATVALWS